MGYTYVAVTSNSIKTFMAGLPMADVVATDHRPFYGTGNATRRYMSAKNIPSGANDV